MKLSEVLSEKEQLKRRSSIEATIGHMKSEGLLAKSYLKGVKGNEINAILCGLGHNIRLILKNLRLFLFYIFYQSQLGQYPHQSV